MAAPGTIRLAEAADADAVRAVVDGAYRHYIARIGQKPGPMLDDYDKLIADGRVRVMDAGGTVRGVLVLVPEADAMLLDNVAVAPDAQGKGFGWALMRYAEQAARQAGLPRIRLYSHVMMTESQALYARLGYKETHRATENGFDRVYMEKPLLP